MYVLFVDFKEAFDTTKRTAIWKALSNKGVPQKIYKIIRAMYEKTDLSVLHNGNTCQPFQTNARIKQGCPLSTLLFTIVLNETMSEVCSKRRGIIWRLLQQLKDLNYADDVFLLSHKDSNMQSKLKHQKRLEVINIKRTKAVRINNTSIEKTMLHGQIVDI